MCAIECCARYDLMLGKREQLHRQIEYKCDKISSRSNATFLFLFYHHYYFFVRFDSNQQKRNYVLFSSFTDD